MADGAQHIRVAVGFGLTGFLFHSQNGTKNVSAIADAVGCFLDVGCVRHGEGDFEVLLITQHVATKA